MCINCCINYIIINFKYNKNYKEEGDVMEIKKLILSLLFISLLSGCNLLESEVLSGEFVNCIKNMLCADICFTNFARQKAHLLIHGFVHFTAISN